MNPEINCQRIDGKLLGEQIWGGIVKQWLELTVEFILAV